MLLILKIIEHASRYIVLMFSDSKFIVLNLKLELLTVNVAQELQCSGYDFLAKTVEYYCKICVFGGLNLLHFI